jgi:ferredoxin-NADP reductase
MNELRTVQDITWHGAGVFELAIDRGDTAFIPGDCLALFAEDGAASRPYSVASSPTSDTLNFIIRHMPGGEVSEYLSERKPGDQVKISPPFGWFRPGDESLDAPFVFIATGTGISPFMAHLRHRSDRPPQKLLYGVRTLADIAHLDWLKDQCALELAISREEVADAHNGRVTELMDRIPLEPGTHYYLCGLDAMIDEVTIWLEGQGVELPHIHRECFFNADYE